MNLQESKGPRQVLKWGINEYGPVVDDWRMRGDHEI